MEDKNNVYKTDISLINIPFWETQTWNLLQEKKYDEALNRLGSILAAYPQKMIDEVFWEAIILGIPAIRGGISEKEWIYEVIPRLATIIFEIGNIRILEFIYASAKSLQFGYFHAILLDNIPGETTEEKVEEIKENENFLEYLVATPLNATTISLFPYPESLPQPIDAELCFDNLPLILKNTLVSQDIAHNISEIGKKYSFSLEEISYISCVVGRILLGISPYEKYVEEFSMIFPENTDKKICDEFSDLLFPYKEEIKVFYEGKKTLIPPKEISIPVTSLKESENELQVKVNTATFPTNPTEETEEKNENSPLLLHKENSFSDTSKTNNSSIFSKGFSLPFGFFKSRKMTSNPRVGVEVAVESSKEKGVTKKELTSSVFETIKKELKENKREQEGVFSRIKINLNNEKNEKEKIIHYSDFHTKLSDNSEPIKEKEGPLIIS